MRSLKLALVMMLIVCGCKSSTASRTTTLTQARQGHKTALKQFLSGGDPVAQPPAQMFRVVSYKSPAGDLAAYLSPSPGDGKKHPAIIWIFGGFGNDIGEAAWEPADSDNDQSAAAFRKAGIIMMYPSLRGGNKNPGVRECLYGEVDDVLAAAKFLAAQDYVDPNRIYLGGHSTGGTLALLVAESTDRFRAVFAFGPVSDVTGYGSEYCPFDVNNDKERELRAPGLWLHSISSPTFVIEGTRESSNIVELLKMQSACHNPRVAFLPVPGKNHFSVLAPVTPLIARKIVEDNVPNGQISITTAEMTARGRK